MNKKAIDLFAGAGGLSTGFIQCGYDIAAAVEFDKGIIDTYRQNHPETDLYPDDIKNIAESNILKKYGASIILGGPPCQGFSMAGARIRKGFIDDERNYLFRHYYEIIKQTKPDFFIFENVRGFVNMDGGKILSEIIKLFEDGNAFGEDRYFVDYKIFNTKDYGIPQKRERVIIIGRKNHPINIDSSIEMTKKEILRQHPTFFDSVTVWDAISNLNSKEDTDEHKELEPETSYQKYLHDSINVRNNKKPSHSDKIIGRIKMLKPGQNWRHLKEEIKSVHSGSYGRLKKDSIAPTITTRFDTPSGGGFTHPLEHRCLTAREGARIQSFPDSFTFHGTKSSIYKQIGNAVPPKLAYFLACMIKTLNDND